MVAVAVAVVVAWVLMFPPMSFPFSRSYSFPSPPAPHTHKVSDRNARNWRASSSRVVLHPPLVQRPTPPHSSVGPHRNTTPLPLPTKAMGIMSKEEWPVFMSTLKDPLPACFRIHSDCSFKEQ